MSHQLSLENPAMYGWKLIQEKPAVYALGGATLQKHPRDLRGWLMGRGHRLTHYIGYSLVELTNFVAPRECPHCGVGRHTNGQWWPWGHDKDCPDYQPFGSAL